VESFYRAIEARYLVIINTDLDHRCPHLSILYWKKKQTPGYYNYHSDKAMDWTTEKSGFDSLFTVARKLRRYQTLLPNLETLNQKIERFGRGSGHSLHSVLRIRMLKPFSIHSHGVLHD
jgi:hypothetical protein